MARGLRLQKWTIAQASHYELHGFRMRIEVVETTGGADPDIFIFKRHPADPFTGIIFDEFYTVASFPDLALYPVGAPNPELSEPWFRGRQLEVDFKSIREYNEFWTLICEQATILCQTLDKADKLVLGEEVWCGAVPLNPEDSLSVESLPSLTAP